MPELPSTHLYFGGDYNPEQWPESVWLDDMRLMKEAGVNLVSIGIFSWAKLQSAPCVFHFEWLDRLMNLLAENKIQADLATATASPPPWLIKLHPEILPTLENGTRWSQGSRQHYNPSSSAYRNACVELVTALANRYKDHPALAMWHINNEYACHVPTDYGDETAAAFREWLKARYGSLEKLNDSWGTAFWSQHYYEWDEILPPRAAPTFLNPGQSLDFQRFSSDALLECCQIEARILRGISPEKPITTNFMEWVKALDYRKWAEAIDFTCLDIYPEPTGSNRPLAQNADMTRSWKDGKPWLIMEQVTTHVNWRDRNATKAPGVMRLWSYQSIARGADGICFFQWRQARAGAEKFHGSMVGHGDPATQRCFQEVKQLGNELAKLSEIAGTRFAADAAIWFDQENWWALELPSKPNNNLKYNRAVENFYTALLNRNIPTDFVFADSDLSRYKLLFVPSLYLVKPGVAEQIEAFVAAGGTAVFTYFSGIVDEGDRVLLGGYPAPFRKLLGLTVEEWAVPPDDRISTVSSNTEGFAKSHTSSFWAEVIRTERAETVAVFDDDYYAGLPAVTRHRFGSGEAWYLGTELEPAFYDELIRHLAEKAGVRAPLDVPEGVEVTRRSGGGKDFIFLLNHGAEATAIDLTGFHGQEMLTGRTAAGSWSLPARGVAILSISNS
jgi:beta-galactosidase